jgi:hypothetical protein
VTNHTRLEPNLRYAPVSWHSNANVRSNSRYGRYHRRLVISSAWPIILLAVVAVGLVSWELLKDRYGWHPHVINDRGNRKAVRMQLTSLRRHPMDLVWLGLQRSLPLTL